MKYRSVIYKPMNVQFYVRLGKERIMELPRYIQDKIKQQNEAVYKAQKLEREIDNWCDKSGIDIWSKEYKETKGQLEDAVAPIDGDQIAKLYK